MADPSNDGHQMENEEGGKKGLTRRAFLGHAAVGAAGVAVGSSLFGASAALADTTQTTVLPKTWTKTYDVVVIGTGVRPGGRDRGQEGRRERGHPRQGRPRRRPLHHRRRQLLDGRQQRRAACAPGSPTTTSSGSRTRCTAPAIARSPSSCARSVENGADTVKWFQDLGINYAPIANGVLRRPRSSAASPPCRTPGVYPGGQGTPNTGISFTMVMYNEVKRSRSRSS